ncbi:hypothetical protein [Xanthomonas sp. NCPPB 1062]|uniref:hypothetical protein n=1 Tax=Xanthomonas sp. NCPPB 1062 TaxID=487523 RepID=UPI003558A1D3
MRERPIRLKAHEVRAILSGVKTQTRLVVKPQPPAGHKFAGFTTYSTHRADEGKAVWAAGEVRAALIDAHRVACPFGQPGDRLWVKETTVRVEEHGYIGPVYVASQEGQDVINWGLAPAPDDCTDVEPYEIKLRPSIHMPRSMCRLVLEITDVRVERLQAISAADAEAEGLRKFPFEDSNAWAWRDGDRCGHASPTGAFRSLWTSTGGDWDANPWVWVISFRRLP